MKAMILAAGQGKRLRPLTNKIPKPLIEVANQPIILDVIGRLRDFGIDEILINVSYLGDQIISCIETSGIKNIHFIKESFPYGTGGALINAFSRLGNDPFILCNADIYTEINLNLLPDVTDAAHIIGVENPSHNISGDFCLSDGIVTLKSVNELTWSGISLIHPQILEPFLSNKIPFDIWNVIFKPNIKKQLITGSKSTDLWVDIGTPETLELARKLVKEEN